MELPWGQGGNQGCHKAPCHALGRPCIKGQGAEARLRKQGWGRAPPAAPQACRLAQVRPSASCLPPRCLMLCTSGGRSTTSELLLGFLQTIHTCLTKLRPSRKASVIALPLLPPTFPSPPPPSCIPCVSCNLAKGSRGWRPELTLIDFLRGWTVAESHTPTPERSLHLGMAAHQGTGRLRE